jgi:hypothetical protein
MKRQLPLYILSASILIAAVILSFRPGHSRRRHLGRADASFLPEDPDRAQEAENYFAMIDSLLVRLDEYQTCLS